MKKIQVQANDAETFDLIRLDHSRVRTDHWYTIWFNGVKLDKSTFVKSQHNPNGEIIVEAR